MGKKRSDAEIARYEHDGGMICNQPASRRNPGPTRPSPSPLKGGSRLSPGRRVGLAVALLSTALALAACAAPDRTSDEERRGGFYGTVSGGMSHP
jgi:hypothetical protein